MESYQNINYGLYTKLPCRTLSKAGEVNFVVEVKTPHKGVVFVEIAEVDKGIFRRATELNRPTIKVMDDIWKLENESMDYLLEKWKTGLLNN